jgi:hypothetical protein
LSLLPAVREHVGGQVLRVGISEMRRGSVELFRISAGTSPAGSSELIIPSCVHVKIMRRESFVEVTQLVRAMGHLPIPSSIA